MITPYILYLNILLFILKNKAIIRLYNIIVIRATKGKAAAFNPLII
jgi:hypothetical protein